MREYLPESLCTLAQACPQPLYLVGGCVRDYLCGFPPQGNADFDLSSPCSEEELISAAKQCGFSSFSVFKRTGTVKLTDKNGTSFEFTRFRVDRYIRGEHRPHEIEFTNDIVSDAKRRDFCANAVYYEIRQGKIVDPLEGVRDIERKILRTVAPAEKVFGEDGLRLMRLGRIAAQTGFSPDEACLAGATEHNDLICDIVPERIFSELNLLLHADFKHGGENGPYRGLKILERIGVLKRILPELVRGAGIAQRPDFHDHDVLEHSLRCVRYSDASIRFAALLHDVGKPFCYFRDGNFYEHPQEGARIAEEILLRLKAPKKLIEETKQLVRSHMLDYNLQTKPSKVRRYLAENYALLPKLLLLKQADFSACKDDLSKAPCVEKWENILREMRDEGAPLCFKELKISGDDLVALGVQSEKVGDLLRALFEECLTDGSRNRREALLSRARVILAKS